MLFENCGACYINGQRIPTKKALKQALADGDLVLFDKTSLTAVAPLLVRSDEIPEGVIMSVVGPHPYTKRAWYANVRLNGDKLQVL